MGTCYLLNRTGIRDIHIFWTKVRSRDVAEGRSNPEVSINFCPKCDTFMLTIYTYYRLSAVQ
jgi:hypothetical protein